jgi:hypothetical protein
MLEFRSARLKKIGGQAGLRDRQIAVLDIVLGNTETAHDLSVEIQLLVPKRPDVTMSEMEEAARCEAQAILAEAQNLLAQSSLAELQARQDAREDGYAVREDACAAKA